MGAHVDKSLINDCPFFFPHSYGGVSTEVGDIYDEIRALSSQIDRAPEVGTSAESTLIFDPVTEIVINNSAFQNNLYPRKC